jgi:hypothetical protein
MAGEKKYRFAGDALRRRDSDPGYRVGPRHKVRFEKGHLEGELSYGEASRRAAELQAKDAEGKVYGSWGKLCEGYSRLLLPSGHRRRLTRCASNCSTRFAS